MISNWPRTLKFSQLFKNTGGEGLFLPWPRSTSNFYALISRNLTSGFMPKFKQHLETCLLWQLKLTEFCHVLFQLVMFLTVFFHWMYNMKYSCYQESSVIHGCFVYWVFGWETAPLVKVGWHRFRFSPCLMRSRV